MRPEVSIIIPNWNGEAFLSRCLAGTLQSAQASRLAFEVLVIDDASSDNSPALVEENFGSAVHLLHNPRNVGFGATVNRGVREATGDVVILLNNDIVPKETLVAELAAPVLHDENVFGVTGKALEWDGSSPNHLNMSARWNRGNFEIMYADPPEIAPTMFLLGGCCALSRKKFLQLEGFSDLFAPGYWEDYDIAYLALKAGWRNLYNPRALAYHFGQGSMVRAFGETRLNLIRERNAWLFTWLNLTDPELLQEHARALPRVAALALASRNMTSRARAKALLQALRMLPMVVRERERRSSLVRRSDQDILNEFERLRN